MVKDQSLQSTFLNILKKENISVSVYLVNGIQLQGKVDEFDQFVIYLKSNINQMIYKHAISTIVPTRNINLSLMDDKPGESDD